LAYISSVILIMAAIANILNRRGGIAALVIAAFIFLFSVLRHLPHFMDDWGNGYKSLALFGGSLIIACSFLSENYAIDSGFWANERVRKYLMITGCLFLAAFFIACGYAHFKFAGFVENFIPSYIPFHVFWTYFCGICLIAGGVGLLIPQTRMWAALLSGIMVLGWFLLLHIPRFIANTHDASDRMGLCESFTFVGIFFVLAGILSRRV
jgi:Predicted membrane protein